LISRQCLLSEVRAQLQHPPFTNFGKSEALAKLTIPVPLFSFEVPEQDSPLVPQELQMSGARFVETRYFVGIAIC
jgi:hypothetical protein